MAAAAAVATVTALPAFLTGALAVQMRADLLVSAGLSLVAAASVAAAGVCCSRDRTLSRRSAAVPSGS